MIRTLVLLSLLQSIILPHAFGSSGKSRSSSKTDLYEVLSVATIAAGIVAQKTQGTANIDLNADVTLGTDAGIRGFATPDHLDVTLERFFWSARYIASPDASHNFVGNLDRSYSFDWTVRQVTQNRFSLERSMGLTYTLTLDVAGSSIVGNCDVPYGFDWPITGSINKSNGQTVISIGRTWAFDVVLRGSISRR